MLSHSGVGMDIYNEVNSGLQQLLEFKGRGKITRNGLGYFGNLPDGD